MSASVSAELRISWAFAQLSALNAMDVCDLFELRQRVFMLEQACMYQDIEALDKRVWHLLGRDEDDQLMAYLRVIPPRGKYPEPAIGRVVTNPPGRRNGLGRYLMQEGIRRTSMLYPGCGIHISAQTYLLKFYSSLGFARTAAVTCVALPA